MDPETRIGGTAFYEEGLRSYGGDHVWDIGVSVKKWDQLRAAEVRADGLLARSEAISYIVYQYVDWDFETRKTQIMDKWKSPLKDMVFGGFPLIDDSTRRKTAEGLIYEAKLGFEATRLDPEEQTKM